MNGGTGEVSLVPVYMKAFKIIALIIILLSACLTIPFKRALVFKYKNTSQIMAYLPVQKQDHFSISYIHSIHLTPVIEEYDVKKNDKIIQTKETYENFGIGMPNNAIGDEIFTHKGKKYIISNMHRIFPFIDLRVGQVISNHTLIYGGHHYPIANYTGKGTWTRLQVQNINLWEMVKGVSILNGKE